MFNRSLHSEEVEHLPQPWPLSWWHILVSYSPQIIPQRVVLFIQGPT